MLHKIFSQIFGQTEADFIFSRAVESSREGRLFRNHIKSFLLALENAYLSFPPWTKLLNDIRSIILETENEVIKSFCYSLYIRNLREIEECGVKSTKNKVGSPYRKNIDLRSVLKLEELQRWGLNSKAEIIPLSDPESVRMTKAGEEGKEEERERE